MSRVSEWGFRALARLIDVSMRTRLSQIDALRASSGEVVLLGDSIVEQGMWGEWFPNTSILNRGIGGNTSTQLLERMNVSSLTEQTRVAFILIGTNDVSQGVSDERILDNVAQIVQEATAQAPRANVYLLSIMPRKATHAARLRHLNVGLQTVAEKQRVQFLDLWPALSAPDGSLKAAFTLDHLHLNGPGYAAWTGLLRPLIARNPLDN